jgi:hypothetical protein
MNQDSLHDHITRRLLHFIKSREERLNYGMVRKGAVYGIPIKLVRLGEINLYEPYSC